jgi:hypothetical protein
MEIDERKEPGWRLRTAWTGNWRANCSDADGSVATLELRRSLAIASAKLDHHRSEQAENEAVHQNSPPSQRTSPRLSFADHMDRLVACDRTPTSPKRSEMLTRVDSSLDRAVVLFEDVIQVRHRPLPTVFVQSAFSFEPHDRRRVRAVAVGVDDARHGDGSAVLML